MRYEIKDGSVVESFSIDAPYDTKRDAENDLNQGIQHNCKYCTDVPGEHIFNPYVTEFNNIID